MSKIIRNSERAALPALLLCCVFALADLLLSVDQGTVLADSELSPIAIPTDAIPADVIPPEAVINWNPETKRIMVIGIDDVDHDVDVTTTVVVEGDDDDDNGTLLCSTLTDDAGNTLEVCWRLRTRHNDDDDSSIADPAEVFAGSNGVTTPLKETSSDDDDDDEHEIEVRVLTLTYNAGNPIHPGENEYEIAFSVDSPVKGNVTHARMQIEVDDDNGDKESIGDDRCELEAIAEYHIRDDTTIIQIAGDDEDEGLNGDEDFDITIPIGGLHTIGLTTFGGDLTVSLVMNVVVSVLDPCDLFPRVFLVCPDGLKEAKAFCILQDQNLETLVTATLPRIAAALALFSFWAEEAEDHDEEDLQNVIWWFDNHDDIEDDLEHLSFVEMEHARTEIAQTREDYGLILADLEDIIADLSEAEGVQLEFVALLIKKLTNIATGIQDINDILDDSQDRIDAIIVTAENLADLIAENWFNPFKWGDIAEELLVLRVLLFDHGLQSNIVVVAIRLLIETIVGSEGDCAPACGKQNIECLNPSPQYDNRRPVGRLLLDGRDICTAWIIGSPDCIITNDHCLDDVDDVTRLSIEFNFECDQCIDGDSTDTEVFQVVELIHSNPDLDYALLRVAGNPADSWGVLSVDPTSPTVDDEIYAIHHAEGLKKGYAEGVVTGIGLPTNPNCDGNNRSEMAVDVISNKGASGSPVFNLSNHCVTGICHCGSPCSDGFAVQMSAIVPDAQPHIENAGCQLVICGACCFFFQGDIVCEVATSESACNLLGDGTGEWQGAGSDCDDVDCEALIGACCLPDGSCIETTEQGCNSNGGTFLGAGTLCAPCAPPIVEQLTSLGASPRHAPAPPPPSRAERALRHRQ